MDFLKKCFGEKISEPTTVNADLETIFKLPIEYLHSDTLFPVSDIVLNDLELVSVENHTENESVITDEPSVKDDTRHAICSYLMKPSHEYADNILPKMGKYITNNVEYLRDTQQMIKNMGDCKVDTNSYQVNCMEMKEIWRTVKEDPTFLERYSYMEFEMLKSLNKSPSFLQIISIINMSSPVLSFLMPILCLLMPFILLKIQGIPISIETYIATLKDVARHHVLGKIINGFSNFSANVIIYLLLTVGLYFYQLYQNYIACIRFYKNIRKINQLLIDMKQYLQYTISSIKSYEVVINHLSTYTHFKKDLSFNKEKLEELLEVLNQVQPFEPSISKIGEIGTLLQCFYELYSNKEFENTLKYSFEFEGYLNNIKGISKNYQNNVVCMATFVTESATNGKPVSKTSFVGQFYPPHINDTYITNDCDLSNNMIITGPNASGKTTFLKTTAINIIFSQQFGCGFYESAILQPYTHIHSYLNIPDTSGRDSLFQAESRRCKDILDIIENSSTNKSRHFAMFDELYSGTNPIEATKSAYSFLKYLSKFENLDYILTTHYVSICERLESSENNVKTWKMDAIETEDKDIQYTYKIKEGVSKIEGAVKVLRDMNYPTEILEEIENFV